jgi:signal transduction histidine kinase
MTSLSVRAEVFSPAGLLVRMRSAALADLLEELLATVIHGAPASRLLLTATTHGDRIHVSITDDMPNVDPAVRQGSVRGLIERVALRGAALDVHVRPTEGTTMTLRLTAAAENRQDRSDTFPPQPPMQPSRGPNSLFSVPAQP